METKTWIYVTLALLVLANVLQLAGLVIPMWIWLDSDSFTVGVGLWYTTGCGIDGTCNTAAPSVSFGYASADTYDQSEFRAVQAFETIGTAGGVLVLLFMILYKIGYGQWKEAPRLNLAAFITCIITVLCVLIGVLVYCGSYWPVVGTSPLLSSTSFPWAMLMCFFAGVLFIIGCLLIRIKCWDGQFTKQAIPVSGDSRIDLHPVTKTGFFHRYFTSPYHATRRPNYAVAEQNGGTGMTGMSKRWLVGSGASERSVSAIDNVAFNGNASDYNYRYLPQTNPAPLSLPAPPPPPPPETVIRPTRLPTPYEVDTHTSDLDRFRRGYDYAVVQKRRVLDEPPFDGDVPHRPSVRDAGIGLGDPVTTRDVTGFYKADGAATRDVTSNYYSGRDGGGGAAAVTRDVTGFYNDGGVTRDLTYSTRYVTTTRQQGATMPLVPVPAPGAWQLPQDEYSDPRSQVQDPVVTSSRPSYIAGVTDPPKDLLLSHNGLDSRFTSDGRLTANADYLPAKYRRGEKALSQVGSNHSGSALQYTTHLGPVGPPTRSAASEGVASMFHPSYIYRPSTKQMY